MSEETKVRRARLIRLPVVMDWTGLGRDSVYRLGKQGRFPKPYKIGQRASAWLESDVLRWIEERITNQAQSKTDRP